MDNKNVDNMAYTVGPAAPVGSAYGSAAQRNIDVLAQSQNALFNYRSQPQNAVQRPFEGTPGGGQYDPRSQWNSGGPSPDSPYKQLMQQDGHVGIENSSGDGSPGKEPGPRGYPHNYMSNGRHAQRYERANGPAKSDADDEDEDMDALVPDEMEYTHEDSFRYQAYKRDKAESRRPQDAAQQQVDDYGKQKGKLYVIDDGMNEDEGSTRRLGGDGSAGVRVHQLNEQMQQ